MKWTVGLTTAPRKEGYYLDRTLKSLRVAGFGDVVVFAEPCSLIPQDHTGPVVFRRKTYGDWTNWATGLYELLLSEPDTDMFLMVEDDVIFCKTAREYLDHAIPQLGDFGSLSLYTPSVFHRKRFCGFHNELRGMKTWSTVTVAMRRDKVISFFSDPDVQRHRFEDIFGEDKRFWCCPFTDPKNSIKDAVLGLWASKHQLPIYYHTPALAEHIGDFSTLTDQQATVKNGRMSLDFVGEDYDLSDWLSLPVTVRSQATITAL